MKTFRPLRWGVTIALSFIFIFGHSQTMTFDNGVEHPGFIFSNFSSPSSGGFIFIQNLATGAEATVRRADGSSWSLKSFETRKFGLGGSIELFSENGNSYTFFPNDASNPNQTHNLNWENIRILTFKVGGGTNAAFDIDNLMYALNDPCSALGGDSDGDGVCDADDECPDDPNKIVLGQCGCGVVDADSDGDGIADCNDGCPADPGKTTPGVCGCGFVDTDSDLDGTPDCNDGCPDDPGKTDPGVCGCGVAETDSDLDGTPDCNDGCPSDPDKIETGQCGCGISDLDTDNDGIADCIDPDDDNDGQSDNDELQCGSDPLDVSSTSPDNDFDSAPDCVDPDDDNDGIVDLDDNCPLDENIDQKDVDSDGIGDACDPLFDVGNVVDNITIFIEDMLDLKRGQEHSLKKQIADVITKFCGGETDDAIDKLQAFMNHVSAYENGGIITSEEAETLMKMAGDIMIALTTSPDSINCPASLRSSHTGLLDINVFPNPVTNMIYVESLSNELGQITITDQLGKVISTRKVNDAVTTIELDRNYVSGMYYLIFNSGGQTVTKKILVTR